MPFGAAGRKGQDRIAPVEGLDGGLLIETEYNRVLGRVQIEGDDIRRLGLEIGVVGGHVALEPVGLESSSRPDPGYPHMRHPQVPGELATTPMGAAIGWSLASSSQDLGFGAVGFRSRLATLVPGIEPVQPLSQEPGPPEFDKALAAVELGFNLGIGPTLSQQKYQPCSLGILSSDRTPLGASPELILFDLGKNDGRG